MGQEQLTSRISAFRASVSDDLYSVADFVGLSNAEHALASREGELGTLQDLLDEGELEAPRLADALVMHPRIYAIICDVLFVGGSVTFEDGRRLPSPTLPPRDLAAATDVAETLLALGIAKVLGSGIDIKRLLLVVELAKDAPRRRFRAEARIQSRIVAAITDSLARSQETAEGVIQLGTSSLLPARARGVADWVVTVGGLPRVAIARKFETHSGGRQTRELRTLFPAVQTALNAAGVSLIVIADGLGMRSVSEVALKDLFAAVPDTMTLKEAEGGALHDAIRRLVAEPPPQPSVDSAAINTLIASALEQGQLVTSTSLPVSEQIGRLALATYATANNQLDLSISNDGGALRWGRAPIVEELRRFRIWFEPTKVATSVAHLFGAMALESESDSKGIVARFEDDPVFTDSFFVIAADAEASGVLMTEAAKQALEYAPASRVAIVVVRAPLTVAHSKQIRDAQSLLPITVVVLDLAWCLQMAKLREEPRRQLQDTLLTQTDLTKLSPFVVRGVTPPRIFFGRDEEEASLISTLRTNSVALLGGRRIGKTSLMRHLFGRLQGSNMKPFFADCQVVRTWADFGVMAAREWKATVPSDFKPKHLIDLVGELRDFGGPPLVFMLDEIDQLLDWDTAPREDEVPEAFFRTCRAISQQGLAQFVFSGERTISSRIWDATSPHWNFCKPLMLRQLTREAAGGLMSVPFANLGVQIREEDDFLRATWEVTDGHPELLQFVGDRIVDLLNQRDRSEISVSVDDVRMVSDQYEYAEQYLETYWGQATPLERIISILVVDGPRSVAEITTELSEINQTISAHQIQTALRMLELYGVLDQSTSGHELRALWFPSALKFYGGTEAAIDRYVTALAG